MANYPLLAKLRGFRNNNPGNIRIGEAWEGLSREQHDSAFCQFRSIEYGIRAIFHILWAYQDRYQLNTVSDMITRWAPPHENDTEAYIDAVTHSVKSCQHIVNNTFNSHSEILDNQQLACVVAGIIHQENGVQPFNHDFIYDCQEI